MAGIWTHMKSWWKREEVKVNPAWAGHISYTELPQPVQMTRNYKTFANQGYKSVDTLYKVISYISRNGAAIAPKLYTDKTKQKEIESHPLLDKLEAPNPEQSGMAYREAVLGYKLLAGNSFQYAIRQKNRPPDELWPLRPDHIQIMVAKNRGICGYKYEFLAEMIPSENIGHTKFWNPDDDNSPGMGLSPMEAAALNADMMRDGKAWNLAFLQNSARPPGAWTTPALMSKNDRDQLENALNRKFSGAKNAGRIPVLDGGLKWESMGLAPADMQFLELLKYNGGSIANIYNIAPQLIGDTSSSTYDNMEQAKVASYTEAIFPELDDLYALWNVWLLPMYPDLAGKAYLSYDKESVEVIQKLLQAQKDAQAERANKLWMSGLFTQNEARELAGMSAHSQGDLYRIGQVLVPADKLMDWASESVKDPEPVPPALAPFAGGNQGQEEQPEKTEQNAEEKKPQADRSPDEEEERKILPYRTAVKALDLETAEQKQAYAEEIERIRERWQRIAEKRLQAYFESEHKALANAVTAAAIPGSAAIRAESALSRISGELQDILVKLYQEICVEVGEKFAGELKMQRGTRECKDSVSDFIRLFGSEVLEYLLGLAAQKVTYISETTRAQIQSTLEEGVRAGESIPQLAKRIDDLYLVQIIPNRSTVIARTEVHSAHSYAALESAKRSPLKLVKVWLAADDARTRPTHAAADGQEVPLDEPFHVGGEALMQPGDSIGSAHNVVQCRCSLYFRRVQEGEKSLPLTLLERKTRRDEFRGFMEEVLAR